VERGYIKLYRKVEDSAVWSEPEAFDFRSAWVDLLLRANHRKRRALFRGRTIVIERGQVWTSEKKLADRWRWHRKRVRRFLRVLELEQALEQVSGQHGTIITICNYETYQGAIGKQEQDVEQVPEQAWNRSGTRLKKGRRSSSGSEVPSDSEDSQATEAQEQQPSPAALVAKMTKRYTDPDLIREVIEGFALSRKSGKMSPAVVAREMAKWEKYPVARVEECARIYTDKHADGDKAEEYFMGILRRQRKDQASSQGKLALSKPNGPKAPLEGTPDQNAEFLAYVGTLTEYDEDAVSAKYEAVFGGSSPRVVDVWVEKQVRARGST